MDHSNMRGPAPERKRDFDWSDDTDDVVVPHVAALAVYINPRAQVVIRQEGDDDHGDNFVYFDPHYAESIIDAIRAAAAECRERRAEPAAPPVVAERRPPSAPPPRPHTDHTAAARQRRYRARKGNGATGKEATATA